MTRFVSRNILITGASGSIGSALAVTYAAPGVTLILQGRNEARLEHVAQSCRAKGARVELGAFDLVDIPLLQAWILGMDDTHPLDLVIANQGININIGSDGQGEAWADTDRLLDVNLRATMAIAHAVLPGMRRRGHGQIALLSSLAAYFGLPHTPAYCASKAGVKAFGESLRGWLAPENIGVTVVMPGYVESEMCDAMPGPKPFLWTADRAARKIKQGVGKNRARVSFPFPLNFGTWWLAVLPAHSSLKILRWMGYGA